MIADSTASVTAFARPAHTCSLDWCRHGLNDTTSGSIFVGCCLGETSVGGRYSIQSAWNTVNLRCFGIVAGELVRRFLTSSSSVLLPEPQAPSTVITVGPSSSPGRSTSVSAATNALRPSRSCVATRSLNPRVATGPVLGLRGSCGSQMCSEPWVPPDAIRGRPSAPTYPSRVVVRPPGRPIRSCSPVRRSQSLMVPPPLTSSGSPVDGHRPSAPTSSRCPCNVRVDLPLVTVM